MWYPGYNVGACGIPGRASWELPSARRPPYLIFLLDDCFIQCLLLLACILIVLRVQATAAPYRARDVSQISAANHSCFSTDSAD